MAQGPVLLWLRRDLRLGDHPALQAALADARARGGGLICLFILDPVAEGWGAAPRWRLGEGLRVFADRLAATGSRLILRRGAAETVLRDVIGEAGAVSVHWTRAYDRDSMARDIAVKAALKTAGIAVRSHPGHLLFEPMDVETGQGGPYRVYSPFWRAVKDRPVPSASRAPETLPPPDRWPVSDRPEDWALGRDMRRGAAVVAAHAKVGEAEAEARLERFLDGPIASYRTDRDFLGRDATSGLSENLAWGEIGPRRIWHAGMRAMHEGVPGAEHFLKELVWREFAWHLLYHFPEMDRQNWRREWDTFPWRGDSEDAERWRRGMTGEPIVDAAMRQMYVTGTMHNRARMIVASYLTKHLLTDWRVGLNWFADCLIDWDPAANAMGWQWVAGSGPDAAPYFRVFNPATQAERYDPDGAYRRRFIAEIGRSDGMEPEALAYFAAVPRAWGLDPARPYPAPLVDLASGRERALAAYGGLKKVTDTA